MGDLAGEGTTQITDLEARLHLRVPIVEHRLRHAYIEVAATLVEGGATDSKISIMTGLQRRDIARLRRETAPPQTQRQPLAEIIALWWDDPA